MLVGAFCASIEVGAAPEASSKNAELPRPGFSIETTRPLSDRPVRADQGKYTGPIIDTHVHLLSRLGHGDPPTVLRQIDEAGVDRVFFLPTPNEQRFKDRGENAHNRQRLKKIAPDRIGLLCGSTAFTVWMHKTYRRGYSERDLEKRIRRLEEELESAPCLGIGEIGPYHFKKKPGQAVIEFPMDFRPFLELAGLAAKKNIVFDLHAEPMTPDGRSYEKEVFGGVALLFMHYPNLKLILSHTAMTNAANARSLLMLYPNLMFNLKIVASRSLQWQHLGPITNMDREIYEDWAKLMEDMPERFMVGTDARFGNPKYAKGRYRKEIRRIRRLLGRLDPKTAEMIGHLNAERLFRF